MNPRNGRSRRSTLTVLLSTLLLLGFTGCTSHRPASYSQDTDVDLVAELRAAARVLLRDANRLNQRKPVLTTTLVNIDDLQQSSTFGRQATEIFGSQIARAGVPVIELKMRDTLFIREGTGELALSRELHHLFQAHDAQAVLVGTYAIGGRTLYVNVRLVQTADNIILASHNFSLPLNRDIRTLLAPH